MKKQMFKASVYNLAVRIVKWNHTKPGETLHETETYLATGNALEEEAILCGYTIEMNGYGDTLRATPKYGESLELMHALDAVTASKKAHPLPLGKRYERKNDEEDARWYNAKRYGLQKRYVTSYGRPITCAKETAQNLRHMKIACEVQKADDITYWAQVLTDSLNNMRRETAARMTYPEQITYDLNGTPVNPELPF